MNLATVPRRRRGHAALGGSLDVSFPMFREVRRAVWLCQAALLTWATLGLQMRLPTPVLGGLVVIGLATEALAVWWAKRGVTQDHVLGLLLLDIALHTAVFALSGGPFNPFTSLYLVSVVLAALLLARWRRWLVFAGALGAFGALFAVERFAAQRWELPGHSETMRLHLNGMWVSFVLTGGFVVYFVQQLLEALLAREAKLTEVKRRVAQHEKMTAVTTLAAGAAHELATPLGTIAVANTEMRRALEHCEVPMSVREDAALVTTQLERCRRILDTLSARTGLASAQNLGRFGVAEWLAEALQGLPNQERIRTRQLPNIEVHGPRFALVQAMRNLVKNALEHSRSAVSVEVIDEGPTLVMVVEDDGPSPDTQLMSRWGEPFFTTKQAGGMGLGVFLARVVAEQLGGSLSFSALEGSGTKARFEVSREVRRE